MTYTQIAGGSKPGKQVSHNGTCDLCGTEACQDIYDAAVHVGSRFIWAWTCSVCFTERGGKLGVGCGQHYRRAT